MAIAFRSATASTGVTPAEPSGAAADDIILALVSTETVGTTPTAATGYTLLSADTSSGGSGGGRPLTHHTYWIRRGGSAIANNWSVGGAANAEVCLVCYSGCITSGSPLDVAQSYNEGTDTSAEFVAVTTVTNGCMLVGLQCVNNWAASSSANWDNERIDQGGAGAQAFYDEPQTTAGATPTLSTTCGSNWGATLIALKPAAAAAAAARPIIVVRQAVQRAATY